MEGLNAYVGPVSDPRFRRLQKFSSPLVWTFTIYVGFQVV